MDSNFYIGVDIGTTSTKAVIFEKSGKIVADGYGEYDLLTPDSLTAVQKPDDIFDAVVTAIKKALLSSGLRASQINLVSFSSAMHSLIAVDPNGAPLTDCITWADKRADDMAQWLKGEKNGQQIYARTGTPIHAMSPMCKLLWLKEAQPEVFHGAHKFIGIKEYVFKRLFGSYVVDHSIASATGLLNLKTLSWDEEVLNLIGIDADKLSTLVPTTHVMNQLDATLAKEMGLDVNTPFIVGASDGVLSNLGVNATAPGVVAITIGTSGAIRTVTDKPVTDPKGRIFCYALTENHWVIGGPVNNGGIVLRWIRDELASAEMETAKRLGIDPYDILTQIAKRVNPGSDGLLFHPFLAGERAPLWNANARGSFFGLGLHHKKEHMIRAALEGVILNLYTVMLALQEVIGMPAKIQATGGFARSELWRQMMADIFDQEVVVPESFESSCLGAIVLGMYALGEIKDFSIVADMVGDTHKHTPEPNHVAVYQDLTPIYIHLSRLLEEEYERIADYQKKWVNGTSVN